MATISNGESGSSIRDKLNKAMNTYAVASGTNTYTASLTPTRTAYEVGESFKIKFTNSNTLSSTINIDSVGALTLKNINGSLLQAGDIIAGGIYEVIVIDASNAQISIATVVNLKPSSDQTTTLATIAGTDGDIDGLEHAVQANSIYRFHGIIRIGCSGVGGVKLGVTLPSGATVFINCLGSTVNNGTFISLNIIASASLLTTAFCQEATGPRLVRIDGEVSVGATPGTVQFKFASGTAGQTSTIYKDASNIKVEKIG